MTSSTTRLTSSWRHGLTHWLQRSRASASSAAVSSNNNVVGSGGTRRGSGGSKRAGGAAGNNTGGPGMVSSAPISISIVSNHGHVRTLAPNSFGKVTGGTGSGTGSDTTETTGNKTLCAVTTNTDQCSKFCYTHTFIHHHHQQQQQLCIAGEDRSVVLAPSTKNRPSPRISRGTVRVFPNQIEPSVPWATRTTFPSVTGKTAERCVDLTTENRTSWNIVGQLCDVAESCCASAGDLLC